MPEALKRHLIERFQIDSSACKELGYQDGVCVVGLPSGHLYAYPMSESDFVAFAQSESKGKYYNSVVKGKFTGEKLTSKCHICGSEPEVIGERCSDCGTTTIRPVDTVHKENT